MSEYITHNIGGMIFPSDALGFSDERETVHRDHLCIDLPGLFMDYEPYLKQVASRFKENLEKHMRSCDIPLPLGTFDPERDKNGHSEHAHSKVLGLSECVFKFVDFLVVWSMSLGYRTGCAYSTWSHTDHAPDGRKKTRLNVTMLEFGKINFAELSKVWSRVYVSERDPVFQKLAIEWIIEYLVRGGIISEELKSTIYEVYE